MWLLAHPASPRTYAEAYNKVASAAAKDGEMSEALSFPGQKEPQTVFHDGRSDLLQEWIKGDPARRDLIIDFIVATESAEAPGSP